MSYDPFSRGSLPAGVRTIELQDPARGGRRFAVEIWYPAARAHRGQDLDPGMRDRFTIVPGMDAEQFAVRNAAAEQSRYPLVLFFHGANSHRRLSTDLCTHLASHGYVVASPDFTGNTIYDQVHDLAAGNSGPPRMDSMTVAAANRPLDARLTLDRLLAGAEPEIAQIVDPRRIGTAGVSFGGWTALALNSIDARPAASFPIVPAWGKGPVGTDALSAMVRLDDWGRAVPTFVLAAERDALVMLDAMYDLHRLLAPPKRLAILKNAGHVHFVDNAERRHEDLRRMFMAGGAGVVRASANAIDFAAIGEACRPFSELCPASHGSDTARSLCLAHMDANLKQASAARVFLDGDLVTMFRVRGIDLVTA